MEIGLILLLILVVLVVIAFRAGGRRRRPGLFDRRCPHCREWISDRAKVCPHCTREITKPPGILFR